MKCIGKLCEYYNRNEMKSSFICGLDGLTYSQLMDVDCSIKQKINEAMVKYADLVQLSGIICELQED